MATIKVSMDTRRKKVDNTYPLKLRITVNQKSRDLALGISVSKEDWDIPLQKVSETHPNSRLLNLKIRNKHNETERIILKLEDEGKIFTAQTIIDTLNPSKKKKNPTPPKPTTPTFFEYGDKLVERLKATILKKESWAICTI